MKILFIVLNIMVGSSVFAAEAPLEIVYKSCVKELGGNAKAKVICECHKKTLENITPEGKALLAKKAKGTMTDKDMENVEGGNIFVSFSEDTKLECSKNPNFKFVEQIGLIEQDDGTFIENRQPKSLPAQKAKKKK